MKYICHKTKSGAIAGQTITEYLITAGIIVLLVLIFAVFLFTFKEHGDRVINLVASEYP